MITTQQTLQMVEMLRSHYQAIRRQKNVNKHLRLARATTGHESRVHMQKAETLLSKYESLIEKEKHAKQETK